ncbi:MAG: Rho termination factor N-terminal domain-containing protein [Deltaproteobacteria bacterium]|nr:Rho termination factor N-terminal domain-containing protein [Deltaproteobacteria bacterium]
MRKKMIVKELQKMAKDLGIKTSGLKKVEMIKAIQRAEGNFDCFGTASNYCDQMSCLFRQDCLK